jgi:hypothetical protein
MRSDIRMFTILPILALLTMCAPVQPPPPQPDPVKEEITILRKQLLELQKLQNDTRTKLDETKSVVATLTARLKAVETKQTVLGKQLETKPITSPLPAEQKKKTVKKKVKVRRQE